MTGACRPLEAGGSVAAREPYLRALQGATISMAGPGSGFCGVTWNTATDLTAGPPASAGERIPASNRARCSAACRQACNTMPSTRNPVLKRITGLRSQNSSFIFCFLRTSRFWRRKGAVTWASSGVEFSSNVFQLNGLKTSLFQEIRCPVMWAEQRCHLGAERLQEELPVTV